MEGDEVGDGRGGGNVQISKDEGRNLRFGSTYARLGSGRREQGFYGPLTKVGRRGGFTMQVEENHDWFGSL